MCYTTQTLTKQEQDMYSKQQIEWVIEYNAGCA